MTVEAAIVQQLKADTAVKALVDTRVYQLKLPQNPKYPAVRVQLIDEPQRQHLRGVSRLFRARVQVDASAYEVDPGSSDPYSRVTALADAINDALAGQLFTSGDSPSTVSVKEVIRDSRLPLYEANELRVVRIVQDYVVWWSKPA